MGIIHLSKLKSQEETKIFSRILSLVDEYKPNEVAIEAPFYGKNVQSLKLGEHKELPWQHRYRNIPL